MKNVLTSVYKNLFDQPRDPRYIFVILGSLLIFSLCYVQVINEGMFDSLERPLFQYINSLPSAFYDVMNAITQLGGLSSLPIWIGLAWYLINRRAAITIAGTGFLAWTLAKVFKALAERGRPGDFIDNINLFSGEVLSGFGFPSGHATFSAACAAVLYYQISPKYRKYLIVTIIAVGISRIYLGAHFPLDIIGGWALGALTAAIILMIFGVSARGLSVTKLKKFLNTKGMSIASLRFANVDARGSRPIFMKTTDGQDLFGKVFGKQEHAADWLFKIFRFFRYKNLQAEEPYISSRRNVEIEAFAMLWAKQAGIRVPKIVDIYHYGTYWVSIQERLDAIPLSDHGKLKSSSLEDAWDQVKKLHDANIAHRDLRAANLMVDKQGKVWVIDFGFAEVSASKSRQSMDTAELLMSMSLVAGVDRTVAAALKKLDEADLKHAIPYLQQAVFSGATTSLLKKNKTVLTDLKEQLILKLKIKDEIDEANIVRINRRKVINIFLLAIFVYIIAPQFSDFKDAINNTEISNPVWLLAVAAASLITYVLTGLIYVTLSSVPLKLRESSLVQLAASFISKVIPGGIGSGGLNAKYLTRAGLDSIETAAVISGQAVIGFVMFIIPLGLFLALNGTNIIKLIDISFNPKIAVGIAFAVALTLATLALVDKTRRLISAKLTSFVEGIRNISVPPRELFLTALASLAVTATYIACLYASLQAIGVSIGISAAILAYATAVIAKSAVPTPGGLGPVEAALIATLLTFGVDKENAIAAVLVYRLATFWFPIPFSLLAYKYINKKRLI